MVQNGLVIYENNDYVKKLYDGDDLQFITLTIGEQLEKFDVAYLYNKYESRIRYDKRGVPAMFTITKATGVIQVKCKLRCSKDQPIKIIEAFDMRTDRKLGDLWYDYFAQGRIYKLVGLGKTTKKGFEIVVTEHKRLTDGGNNNE